MLCFFAGDYQEKATALQHEAGIWQYVVLTSTQQGNTQQAASVAAAVHAYRRLTAAVTGQ